MGLNGFDLVWSSISGECFLHLDIMMDRLQCRGQIWLWWPSAWSWPWNPCDRAIGGKSEASGAKGLLWLWRMNVCSSGRRRRENKTAGPFWPWWNGALGKACVQTCFWGTAHGWPLGEEGSGSKQAHVYYGIYEAAGGLRQWCEGHLW